MRAIIIPFVHYTRRYMPKFITAFLERVAEKEFSNIKYWFISGVMGFTFVIFYLGLFRS